MVAPCRSRKTFGELSRGSLSNRPNAHYCKTLNCTCFPYTLRNTAEEFDEDLSTINCNNDSTSSMSYSQADSSQLSQCSSPSTPSHRQLISAPAPAKARPNTGFHAVTTCVASMQAQLATLQRQARQLKIPQRFCETCQQTTQHLLNANAQKKLLQRDNQLLLQSLKEAKNNVRHLKCQNQLLEKISRQFNRRLKALRHTSNQPPTSLSPKNTPERPVQERCATSYGPHSVQKPLQSGADKWLRFQKECQKTQYVPECSEQPTAFVAHQRRKTTKLVIKAASTPNPGQEYRQLCQCMDTVKMPCSSELQDHKRPPRHARRRADLKQAVSAPEFTKWRHFCARKHADMLKRQQRTISYLHNHNIPQQPCVRKPLSAQERLGRFKRTKCRTQRALEQLDKDVDADEANQHILHSPSGRRGQSAPPKNQTAPYEAGKWSACKQGSAVSLEAVTEEHESNGDKDREPKSIQLLNQTAKDAVEATDLV